MRQLSKKSNEIHWMGGRNHLNPGPQANQKVQDLLPADVASHFARLSPSFNSYVWQYDAEGAVPLSQASPAIAAEGRTALEALFSKVRSAVSDATLAETLTTYPNDDYILCYKDASGRTDVVITGWGFMNRRGPDVDVLKRRTDRTARETVRIGFTEDGQVVPRRSFVMTNNPQTTDADGYYHFDTPLPVGQHISVKDAITQRVFDFDVLEGKSDYVFDVTRRTTVNVHVSRDEAPVAGAQVVLRCQGKEFPLTTDPQGNCLQQIVYKEGETVEASWEDQSDSQPLTLEGNRLSLASHSTPPEVPPVIPPVTPPETPPVTPPVTPPETPPVLEKMRIRVVDRNGNFLTNTPIRLLQAPQTSEPGLPAPIEAMLDGNGEYILDKHLLGPHSHVTAYINSPVRPFPPIMFDVSPDENDYLLEEVGKKTPWWMILLEILLVLGIGVGLYFLWPHFIGWAVGLGAGLLG